MENIYSFYRQIAIALFLCFSTLANAQDFKVQHIQADVDENNTIVNTTSITAVSSLTSAFAIPGNNKMTHAGRSDSNDSDLEGDDMAGARVLTSTTALSYYRESASHNDADGMNFQTMIWEYTGAASGPNEFIVRGRYAIDLDGATSGVTEDITNGVHSGTLSAITSTNKCIPFITGILNDATNNQADSGTAIAWLSDGTTLEVRKGTNENNVTVYITLVEFTGSNWSVLHGTSGGNSDATGTITLKDGSAGTGITTDVGNWNNSIIFHQSKAQTRAAGGSKQRIDGQYPLFAPGANNQSVDWTFDAGRNATNNKSNHFVHILENSEIEVTRYTDTSSADDESTIDITSASLTGLDQAMILGTSITSGNETTYGRGWRNYYFNSTTQAAHWSHRSGNTMSHNIQVVNFDPPATQTEAPGGVTTSLELWLKADEGVEEAAADAAEDGDSVLNWLDNTISTNDASQSTGANQPTYNEAVINFNPAISFDGTNHEMTASEVATGADVTIFAVAEGTYSTTKTLLNLDNGANGSIDVEQTAATTIQGSYTDSASSTSGTASATVTSGIPSLINYRQQTTGGANRIFVNGVQTTGGTPNANTLTGNFTAGIGADPSTSSTRWNGEIGEIIVYNYKVPATERYRIESYLGIKYGITIGINGTSQDYVDTDDRVIWDQSANVGYNYNVTGIGRDDVTQLEQKQSKTVNTTDDITIGIKGIETTNQGNTTEFFSDKTFLMWGNDDGALTHDSGNDISKDFGLGTTTTTSTSAKRIDRIWKMVVTDSVPTIKLSIPKSMVSATNPGDADEYIMIISDDDTFSTNVTSATMNIVGSDLEVDWYFENTKYISFGSTEITTAVSRSASFDRSDSYISAGDVNDLANMSYTISAWLKREPGVGKFDVVSKRNYYDEDVSDLNNIVKGYYDIGYAFRINEFGNLRMVWRDPDDTANNIMETTANIPEDEWHHVCATYDMNEGANGTTRLYIDGILTDTDDTNSPIEFDNDSHFMIGAAHHIKRQQRLNGSVDEVRVWNVALSADQIQYVMNQEIEENATFADGKVLPTATTRNEIETIPWNNLIAYYPMSRFVFGSVKDESNSGNDASMISYDLLDEQTAPLPYQTTQDGDWDDETTWVNGDVQYLPGVDSYQDGEETIDYNIVEISHNVTLDNSDTALIPAANNENRTVLGLMINSGELEIQGNNETDTGYGLTVSHYLKLDGKIDLEGESQLIQAEDSDLDVTSSGTLEKDQQGTADLYTYNYWAAPVGVSNTTTNNNSYTLPNVMQDGTTAATPQSINWLTSGYDGTSGSPVGIADYWVWKYANQTSDDYASWQHVRSSGSLQAGEGFTMKGTTDTGGVITTEQNYVFEGKPHNGDITLTLSSGNDYLVGNPYASAIDADEFILDNTSDGAGRAASNIINGTLYFWDHFANESHYLSDYEGGYATYNLLGTAVAVSNDTRINNSGQTGTKEPGQYIPVGQGFFVTATDGGT
ncbi:LamG domain-containing protein, partial [Flavobacteriaceae sp. LMIT009]